MSVSLKLKSVKVVCIEWSISSCNGKCTGIPVHLPLQDEMLHSIQTTFTDFNFRETLIDDSYIVNHHLERDRTEVTDL